MREAGSMMKAGMFALAISLGLGVSGAQNGKAAPSDQDKQFVTDTAQDGNFEIKTGQLALQASKSADVRAYAEMLIHDHTALKTMIHRADTAAGVPATPATSMSSDDRTMYDNLKGLKGNDFDQAYIKELVKGNEKGVDETKSATSSSVPAVKSLAEKRQQLDSKHTEKAKELAKKHNVSA